MKSHGNSYTNDDTHHLYVIRDKTTQQPFKYGICGHPLRADGTSGRAEFQVAQFNQIADWERFYAIILLTDIPGRTQARQLEDDFIDAFKAKFGDYPKGNPNHKRFNG
jgi:hypothetical protein